MKTYLRFLLLGLSVTTGLNFDISKGTVVDRQNNCYFTSNQVTEIYSVRENDTLTNEISAMREDVIGYYKDNYNHVPRKLVVKQEEVVETTEEVEIKEKEDVSVEEPTQVIEYVKPVEAPNPNMDLANSVVNFAVQFVGNPYVMGGTSLTNGTDCSGFTQSVFANFGISLPRSAYEQAYVGNYVSLENIQVGDLVLYGYSGVVSHAALYIGNGQVVHALNPAQGIGITDYLIMPIITVRRVL